MKYRFSWLFLRNIYSQMVSFFPKCQATHNCPFGHNSSFHESKVFFSSLQVGSLYWFLLLVCKFRSVFKPTKWFPKSVLIRLCTSCKSRLPTMRSWKSLCNQNTSFWPPQTSFNLDGSFRMDGKDDLISPWRGNGSIRKSSVWVDSWIKATIPV